MSSESKCPFSAATRGGRSNRDWWPNQLNLNALHTNHPSGDPMGAGFDYAAEFKTLDLDALIRHENAISPLLNGRTVFDDRRRRYSNPRQGTLF